MQQIDVSKCQYYIEDDMCDAVGTVTLHCSKNNCYYKQLEQLKQENKYLKACAEINANIRLSNFYEIKIDKITFVYKQKLEKIKDIAKDIIKNDCYENSDAKAEKILEIIKGEEECNN